MYCQGSIRSTTWKIRPHARRVLADPKLCVLDWKEVYCIDAKPITLLTHIELVKQSNFTAFARFSNEEFQPYIRFFHLDESSSPSARPQRCQVIAIPYPEPI